MPLRHAPTSSRPRILSRRLAVPLLAGAMSLSSLAAAQAPGHAAGPEAGGLTPELLHATIESIADTMIERYIFEDVGREMAALIRGKEAEGEYEGVKTTVELARTLTMDLRSICHDKHVRLNPRPQGPRRPPPDPVDYNFGFAKIEHLRGNIGVIEMRGFANGPDALARADAAMTLLADVDALILDFRGHGGGAGEMFRHFSTYFFSEPTILVTNETRDTDGPEDVVTLETVPGRRLSDVPLYVLTSERTFSGAEAFTFAMKANQRATIVGETTGGGGHYGGTLAVNEHFTMFVPVGRAYDKRTGVGWERTGVAPDIEASRDEALTVALEHAQGAARAHAEIRRANRRKAMQEKQSPTAAIREHAAANDMDEAYMNDGQNELAILNYEKSLDLEPDNDHAREMIRRMRGQ